MKPKKLNPKLLWMQFEDVLAPRLGLSVKERAVYSYLLRHSLVVGKLRLQFAVMALARTLGLSIGAARQAVRRLDELDLLHLRGDRHYYETHGPRDHIHVACLGCGKVREFESRLYEQLKQQIARDFRMKVTVSRTEVGGYCAECLEKSSS